jgi:hypothetical protein
VSRVRALGIEIDGPALDAAFARFQVFADRRGEVGDADLFVLCGESEARGANAGPMAAQ